MQSLIFFNKEGDNLNFTYNEAAERWEGDLLFHENSDDTYKTIGLYAFERIPTFDYENVGNMKLKKFQLFNEYRFQFTGNDNFTQSVRSIELPNNDSSFYSKWIYGEHFESKFPKGSQIRFNSPVFEFTNSEQTYTVVQTKKDGILILGNLDNNSFQIQFGNDISMTSSYDNLTISGINSIGFYNYINSNFIENFSQWSEPLFYERFYKNRKLNIVNTNYNDGIVTVKNKDLIDRVYYNYSFSKLSLTKGSEFDLKLTFKTETPKVYEGRLSLDGNRVNFANIIPITLKPGVIFSIPTSQVNKGFISVASIPTFLGNSNLKMYELEEQVIWNNLVYQCVQSYTWSATSSINPDNTEYWSRPKYLPTIETLVTEQIYNAEIHLSSNVLLYTQSYTQSSVVTLNSFIEKYKSEFNFFDLDLYYEDNSLHCDLIYPTNYVLVDFYLNNDNSSNYGIKNNIYERLVEVKETLKTELNENINENFKYRIVFVDLDDFGLKIKINNQVFDQSIIWVYEDSNVNLQKTIDKTLRKWYENWYLYLFTLGINVKIGFTGIVDSYLSNTIELTTTYPNVPLDFIVEVGDTADFYIEHSEIIFKQISNYLNVVINDRSYGINSVLSDQKYNISQTLSSWIDLYSETIRDYGIIVLNINNTLIFRVKEQYQRLEYIVQVGKSGLPAEELYIVRQRFNGTFGSLIASNEIILPEGYTKYTPYLRQFRMKEVSNLLNVSINDLPITGDVAFIQGPFTTNTTELAFREDDINGLSMISWLDGVVGTTLTIRNANNLQYYVKYNIDSVISSSVNFRHYNVTYVESNGEWVDINNGIVDISYVGEFDFTKSEVFAPTWSFEDEDFATGQVVGINNTVYPYDNQEYNIINLDPQSIVLDYRGPFWSTIEPKCEVSPFVTIGFDSGFGATGCVTITQSIDLGGEFFKTEYSSSFQIVFGTTNSYSAQKFLVTGNENFKDIIYTNITENLYILGNRLTVFDANLGLTKETVDLLGLTGPIKLDINSVNQYIYCLSDYGFHIVDPRLNTVESSFTFSIDDPNSFEIDPSNGDVYLYFKNSPDVQIWSSNNITNTPSRSLNFVGNLIDFEYNPSEKNMYVATSDDKVQIIDSDNGLITNSYQFNGIVQPLFYEPSESSIYIFDSSGLNKINNGSVTTYNSFSPQSENHFIYNNNSDQVVISQTNGFIAIKTDGTLQASVQTPAVGGMAVNQFDGDVYLGYGNELKVLDTIEGKFKWSETFDGNLMKIIYNPSRNSIFGIVPTPLGVVQQTTNLVELSVTLGNYIKPGPTSSVSVDDTVYGTLDPNYQSREDTWLKVREYVRKPKSNFRGDVITKLVWKWENDQVPDIFLYDFSGDQLTDVGSYSYIGEKPLKNIRLNNNPNKDLTKIHLPEYQQTIFPEIIKSLDYLDSDVDIKIETEPLEIFIGYNSKDEGPTKSTLKLYKREEIDFTITPTPDNYDVVQLSTNTDGELTIVLNQNSDKTFYYDDDGNYRGLKPGQTIQLFISDVTNTRDKYISHNNGVSLKINHVFNKTIIGTKIDRVFVDEQNIIADYPKSGKTTYLAFRFKTIDTEIGSFDVYGQTQIEDTRFKIELGNVGQLVNADDIYIFKEYDINEQGFDWVFLNKKRKELLLVRDQIYSFIGSYKAIINAINYFGYNDLELYEYYRNINSSSKDYGKLFKVEIPDIFDNSVPGWQESDFIKKTLPNPSFEDTNLFNLTFSITDKEGNNILSYSLQEVVVKLQGLKRWLESNIIPLSHRILDITGRADFVGSTGIQHRSYDTRIIKIKQSFTPINFKLNEAYLMPINSGSTVYTCVLDFSVSQLELSPDYFTIKIRTYQTHKEWQPFKIYNKGDKVQYFQQIYESAIDNNRLRNPRKFDNVQEWSTKNNYNLGDYASYYRDIYQYVGTQSSFTIYGSASISPVTDINTNFSYSNWILMTEWKKSDYLPVQTLTEFRTGTHSYIFTIDSNLDPFLFIEVTSDNGYGQVYNNKKSYEIRGIKDLVDDPGRPDPMGPFNPILFVESSNFVYATFSVNTQQSPIFAGETIETTITADEKVLNWNIVDLSVTNGCIVNISLIPIDLYSANLLIQTDPLSETGIYSFVIKTIIKGGNSTRSSTITGHVNKVVCPTIYVNGNVIDNGLEIPTIDAGLSYQINSLSTSPVVWEISDLYVFDSNLQVTIDEDGIAYIESFNDTPTGIYSFYIRAVSKIYPSCEYYTGQIFGIINNPSISGNYYSAKVNISCNNYTIDTNVTDLNYSIFLSNIQSPLQKAVSMSIERTYDNKYNFYIFVESIDPTTAYVDLITDVVITNYQNTEVTTLTAVYTETLDNNGLYSINGLQYKLEWNISGQSIQVPPCDFDIRINFL